MSRKAKLGPLRAAGARARAPSRRGDRRPLVVAGARELVPLLARELRAGGDAAAVREDALERRGGARLGRSARRGALRAASRAGVPIVAVTEARAVPYVLETDLVRVPPGQGFPVEEIAAALARRLGEDGTGARRAAAGAARRGRASELIRDRSRSGTR